MQAPHFDTIWEFEAGALHSCKRDRAAIPTTDGFIPRSRVAEVFAALGFKAEDENMVSFHDEHHRRLRDRVCILFGSPPPRIHWGVIREAYESWRGGPTPEDLDEIDFVG